MNTEQDESRIEEPLRNFWSNAASGSREKVVKQNLQVRYKSEPKKDRIKLSKQSAQSISKSLRKLSKDIDLIHFEQLSTLEAIKMESELY